MQEHSNGATVRPRESTLVEFFAGRLSVRALDDEWRDAFDISRDGAGNVVSRDLRTVALSAELEVTPSQCVLLVDSVVDGALSHGALDAICFALEASDAFGWDGDTEAGERVATALFWLGTPEINYPLSIPVLRKIRHYLLTGEKLLTRSDVKR